MAFEIPYGDLLHASAEKSSEVWRPAYTFATASSPPGDAYKAMEHPQFPCEFPYESNLSVVSAFSSPVESLAGSNEIESGEDDDYTAGLAEQIAHSMLDDEDAVVEQIESNGRRWALEQRSLWASADVGKTSMAVSPQSTLPGLGSWSIQSWSSNSAASSKGSSQVSSPPSTPLEGHNDAWDLLYAAAGEVVRLKINEERNTAVTGLPPRNGALQLPLGSVGRRSNQRQEAAWKQPSQVSILSSAEFPALSAAKEVPAKSRSFSALPFSVFCGEKSPHFQRSLSDRTRDEDLKMPSSQARTGKHVAAYTTSWSRQGRAVPQHHITGGGRAVSKAVAGQRHPWGGDTVSSQWPPSQPTGGSGMRAVFLGTNASGRESGGTGVFLPRRLGTGSDTKKKPTCSTVLLPSRVVQALKLNLEDVRSPPMVQNTLLQHPMNRKDLITSVPTSPAIAFPGLTGDSQTPHTLAMENWVDSQWKPLYPIPICSPLQQAAPELSLPTEWTY